jgi:hypothetical protein
VGSLSQFEEYAGPLLRGHLSAGGSVGGIGFLKAVEDADYFLHTLNLTRETPPAWALQLYDGENTPKVLGIDSLEAMEENWRGRRGSNPRPPT